MERKHELRNPPDSTLETFGAWATIIMENARDLRVVPLNKGTARGGELLLKADGTIERPTREFVSKDLTVEKVCPAEIQVKYSGSILNKAQLNTIRQIELYAKWTGKLFTIEDPPPPYFSFLSTSKPQPLMPFFRQPESFLDLKYAAIYPPQESKPFVDRAVSEYEKSLGLSRAPEGKLIPKRVLEAVTKAEIEAGFNIDIISALRTTKEQADLFRELSKEQAVAPSGSSYHELSRGAIAIDVDNWPQAQPYLLRHGFVHGDPGGGPLWNDPWHFAYVGKV